MSTLDLAIHFNLALVSIMLTNEIHSCVTTSKLLWPVLQPPLTFVRAGGLRNVRETSHAHPGPSTWISAYSRECSRPFGSLEFASRQAAGCVSGQVHLARTGGSDALLLLMIPTREAGYCFPVYEIFPLQGLSSIAISALVPTICCNLVSLVCPS